MFTKTLLPDTLRAIKLIAGVTEIKEDAEQIEQRMPQMLTTVAWEEVKEYFRKETNRLTEKKLQA